MILCHDKGDLGSFFCHFGLTLSVRTLCLHVWATATEALDLIFSSVTFSSPFWKRTRWVVVATQSNLFLVPASFLQGGLLNFDGFECTVDLGLFTGECLHGLTVLTVEGFFFSQQSFVGLLVLVVNKARTLLLLVPFC